MLSFESSFKHKPVLQRNMFMASITQQYLVIAQNSDLTDTYELFDLLHIFAENCVFNNTMFTGLINNICYHSHDPSLKIRALFELCDFESGLVKHTFLWK